MALVIEYTVQAVFTLLHKAQCIVSAVHSATGPPAGITRKTRQTRSSAGRECFGLTLFACCGNVLGNHGLLTALSSQIHYNTGSYASKSLWSAFCCSCLWFQTTIHICAALSEVEQFVLFPFPDIFHWNTEQVLQKALTKTKACGLFKRHPLWFLSAVILGSGDFSSSSVFTTESWSPAITVPSMPTTVNSWSQLSAVGIRNTSFKAGPIDVHLCLLFYC